MDRWRSHLYRVFVDEVGNHDMKSCDKPTEQYLGVTGVIIRLEYEEHELTAALNQFKTAIFGSINIVLHRRDILIANLRLILSKMHIRNSSSIRLGGTPESVNLSRIHERH